MWSLSISVRWTRKNTRRFESRGKVLRWASSLRFAASRRNCIRKKKKNSRGNLISRAWRKILFPFRFMSHLRFAATRLNASSTHSRPNLTFADSQSRSPRKYVLNARNMYSRYLPLMISVLLKQLLQVSRATPENTVRANETIVLPNLWDNNEIRNLCDTFEEGFRSSAEISTCSSDMAILSHLESSGIKGVVRPN